MLFEGSEIIGKCNKDHHQITTQYLKGKHSHRSDNTALSCSRPNISVQSCREELGSAQGGGGGGTSQLLGFSVDQGSVEIG